MNAPATRGATPRPFVKWAGGKGQLLPELVRRVEEARPFGRYHEPFVGGGALFFELFRTRRLPRKQSLLSDGNDRLMCMYRCIKEDVEQVIRLLLLHKEQHDKAHYYAVRAEVPSDAFEQAARLIYLNRTCFNGLFRENSKGLFNVPMGRYKNPMICDEQNLRAVAGALKGANLETRPFEEVLRFAKKGDLVYFDPPYHPVSKTASFTAYHNGGFGEDSQRMLAEVAAELHAKGVKVLLSNSDTPFVRELYRRFAIEQVYATRLVNSRASCRGKVPEALVRNF